MALLESVRRMLLVEWSWNLQARGQEGEERQRHRGCWHPHFHLAAVGSRAALTSVHGPSMRGAILDSFCIETQTEKKLESTQSKCLGRYGVLYKHIEKNKKEKRNHLPLTVPN